MQVQDSAKFFFLIYFQIIGPFQDFDHNQCSSSTERGQEPKINRKPTVNRQKEKP